MREEMELGIKRVILVEEVYGLLLWLIILGYATF